MRLILISLVLGHNPNRMILNYLLLTIRTYFKNKTAFAINLLGMAIALGCCITACVNYEHSAGIDKQQTDASNLPRICSPQQTETATIPYGVAPLPLGNLVMENPTTADHDIQYTA